MKYAITYKGESEILAGFHNSEAKAIKAFNDISDEPFDPSEYTVQCFTNDEIREIKAFSEAHPQ